MPIDKALEELKKFAQEFTNIGDAEQAIQKNKDDFLRKWFEVNRYYKYIINNAEFRSPEWLEAIDIVGDISIDNPSLEKWVDDIFAPPKKENTITQPQNNTSIDTTAILNGINSIVSEINGMQQWDPDHVDDLEWKLEEYRDYLTANQSSFDQNMYQSLMNDINASLNKISRFNSMINSDAMEGIKRM